ncbi:rhamnan synthesis F family protein [Enterococcus xiangfangensis]|uniref:Rhamnan synthesis F family protein n=1 Tax=Enterococcus xiangfangensis TaxID=1296537 RepID=A0ABU3F9K1_9ENTE|nr:rhamnan synthesis F family protein [Enterococcus xiangfangensis]MDT2758345.1 rhamnan synthesis F family protein [Enterococcus xiangfangensis]
MDNTVSVVVTCYNHGQYIEQCLRSIFSQTYGKIKLLIINDGSTDNSEEIIKNIIVESPFDVTEYVYQENSGICVTRNKGLQWNDSEFILFVDSDNYLDANYIEVLLKTAVRTKKDIIYTDLIDADTAEVFMASKPYSFEEHLRSNYIDNCSLIRSSKIGDTRYDLNLNRKKLVDYDFILNLVITKSAQPKQAIGTKLNYRVLNESISRKGNHGSERFYYETYLYILKKYASVEPNQVFDAIGNNLMSLEDRLIELIDHLEKVTEYVHSLETAKSQLEKQNDKKHIQIEIVEEKIQESEKEKTRIALENNYLVDQINDLEAKVNNLQATNADLTQQQMLVLNSKSYRLGNMIVKPLKYSAKIVRNPRLLKNSLRRVLMAVKRRTSKLPSVKGSVLRIVRNANRMKNNYDQPKRFLVYVIYENQDRLQEYKYIFLKELAAIVEDVLIVINGGLPEIDIQRLAQLGEVQVRDNSGYDTAAFRYGIEYLGKKKLKQYDELLLINDTNVGPMSDLNTAFAKMANEKLDFWGVSYGEFQPDFTGYNRYKHIPIHLQSYFLVIEKSLLNFNGFYDYWSSLGDTNSREKAIGKHETVFTKYFADLGFKHGALATNNQDSPMYIHPLMMLKEGIPLVKYSAFANYNNDKFAWQGLKRETEVPALLEYIKNNTDYPMSVIDQIMFDVKNKVVKQHILLIDGIDNIIPQLTTYRVTNKAEQLKSLGYDVWTIPLSSFQMGYAEHASHIIIYRAGYNDKLVELCNLAKKYHKPILYDIDDLVIDTKYTDQLEYTQMISVEEKINYDAGVESYGRMLNLCDGAIATTAPLKKELRKYKDLVLINRNLASKELVEISLQHTHQENSDGIVRIGYFSGSITHNENFELIKPSLKQLLKKYPYVQLNLVGHLDIPQDLKPFNKQITIHEFVPREKLPELIGNVDINLAPLVDSVFNRAKSEIKWIEAALVKVPTVASDLGSFAEMIVSNETGILVSEGQWYEELEKMILSKSERIRIAENAFAFVLKNCTTTDQEDELTNFIKGAENERSV